MDSALKYVDMTDKAYGLAGMAVALVAWDAEELLESIDLAAAPEEAMHMTSEFYLCMSPRVGAKAAWEQTLKRFQIVAGLTVANVVCRQMVHKRLNVSAQMDNELQIFLLEEGKSFYCLDDDEVRRVYGKSLSYCRQLFSHPGVCQVAVHLADEIISRKTLGSAEVFEILAPLSRM